MKELITPANEETIRKRLEELLVRSRQLARPLYPRMDLDFRVWATEIYFSTTGRVFWYSPFWRGDNFSTFVMLHEGFHWVLYPVDLFRSLSDVFEARRMLAQELGYQPKKVKHGLYREDEDWSDFEYKIEEFQLVANILGDYLINLHIHDNYPMFWNEFWNFLVTEGTLHIQEKKLQRDTTFMLYIAAYHYLRDDIPEVKLFKDEHERLEKIAMLVRYCMERRVTTKFAIKELVKLFHEHITQDMKEGEGQVSEPKCPKCGHDEFEIVAVQKADGTWERL